MTFNHVENAFLAEAIKGLQPKWEKVYGIHKGPFYIGNGITFMVVEDGPDKNKLTVAKKTIDGKFVPDPQIEPEDCYNLFKPGECLGDAVRRVFGGYAPQLAPSPQY